MVYGAGVSGPWAVAAKSAWGADAGGTGWRAFSFSVFCRITSGRPITAGDAGCGAAAAAVGAGCGMGWFSTNGPWPGSGAMGSDWAAVAGTFASATLTVAAIGSGVLTAGCSGAVSAEAGCGSFCSGASATWVTVPSARGGVVSNCRADPLGSAEGSDVWLGKAGGIEGTFTLTGAGAGAGSEKKRCDLVCQIRAPTKITKTISPIQTTGRFFFCRERSFSNVVTSKLIGQNAVVTPALTHEHRINILVCVKSKRYLSIMS